MRRLLKKMLRDMLDSKGQFISIILVIATGVGFFSGLFIMADSLAKNVAGFYDDTNLADIWAYYGGIDQKGIDDIRQIKGVSGAEGRLKLEGLSGDPDDNRTFFVYTLPADNNINVPKIVSGRLPENTSECMVCEPTAKANGLSVGENLDISISGQAFSLTISGLFLSPEYVFQIKDASVAVPDYHHFGILFVHHDLLATLAGGREIYNEVGVTVDENSDVSEITAEIATTTAGYNFGYALPREKQTSYSIIDYKIQSISKVAKVFPILFFAVAAILIFISMSRLVASQRGQIGIMKALGKSRRTIAGHYLSYSVAAGIAGGIIGSAVGAAILPKFILGIITEFFAMPPVRLYGGASYTVTGSALALIIGALAAFLSCRSILKETAAGLMRPKPPKSAKKIWLEKRTRFWKRLPYKVKLILRNLFLNTRRTVIGSVGVIGGCALIFASFSIQGTYSFCMDDFMANRNNYDYKVVLEKPDDNIGGLLESYTSIESVTKSASLPVILAVGDYENEISQPQGNGISPAELQDDFSPRTDTGSTQKLIETTMTVLPATSPSAPDTDAIRLFSETNERMYLPDSGAVITEKLAKKQNIAIGDGIAIRIVGVTDVTEVKTSVSAICKSYFGQGVFISFAALEDLGVSPPAYTYYVTSGGATGTDITGIKNLPGVKAVYTKQNAEESMSTAQDLISTVIMVMIAASAILTLAVIYNITSINIYDRRRDIATLRVLGYHHKEVGRLILVENLIVTAFGAALGVGLGFAMQYALIGFIGTEDTDFPFMFVWWCIPAAVVSVFIFTFIVNFLSKKKIRRIDMVESLKSVE